MNADTKPRAMSVHDTVVLCRPQQLREAAIVLACFPSHQFTPLIVIEPPPVTEEAYRALHEAYRISRHARDAVTGGDIGRLQVFRGQAIPVDNGEVDRKAHTLTPYRSWWRPQLLIRQLLSQITLRRALFLFEPAIDELDLIEAIPLNKIGSQRTPVLPPNVERTYLLSTTEASAAEPNGERHLYPSLAALADLAWPLCSRTTALPHECVEVPEHATSLYLAGLFRALHLGLPLRPINGQPQDLGAVSSQLDAFVPEAREAVLIETNGHATELLGVQYAHQRQAKLVLCPKPDLAAVELARKAMQRQQRADAKSIQYVSVHRGRGLALPELTDQDRKKLQALAPAAREPGEEPFTRNKFLDALRRFCFPDSSAEALRELEKAVSSQIPDYALVLIGALPLTVFTSGMPYNFVNKGGQDWCRKPIGHVAGDPTLLILSELCGTASDAIGFNLVFDSGDFDTSETHDVLTQLQQRVSITLVLSGSAASSLALIHLGETLPLDVVFFNTHGLDDSIKLDDMPLPAYKLVQRVGLRSDPIVLNNSCQSWINVGREFLRVGARAYLGTLWSIDAPQAASFAKAMLLRMVREDATVSQAIHETGVDARTERAYIFVGTCNTRLSPALPEDLLGQHRRLTRAAQALIRSALVLSRQGGRVAGPPYIPAIEEVLLQEAERLLEHLESHWPEPDLERFELLLLYLQLVAAFTEQNRDAMEVRSHVIGRAGAVLDALQLEERAQSKQRAALQHIASRIYLRLGQTQQALDMLGRSIQLVEAAGEPASAQLLELSDVYKRLGNLPQALHAAERAQTAAHLTSEPEGSRHRLMVLGRLASLSNWLSQFDEALHYARDGFQLAVELDDLNEQSEFKADEARALLGIDRPDSALEAAHQALALARQAHDDARELSVHGTITEILIRKGDLDTALANATLGWKLAQHRRSFSSAGAFLKDIATIKTLQSDPSEAFRAWLAAVPLLSASGDVAKSLTCLQMARETCRSLDSWAADADLLKVEVQVMDNFEWVQRRDLTTDIVARLQLAISRTGLSSARQKIRQLARDVRNLMPKASDVRSEQMVFVSDLFQMLDDYASGHIDAARRRARKLDELSAGGFQLVRFLEHQQSVR